MGGGRRGDAHVDLGGAGGADHLDDLAAGGAADDGVVDQDDALALDDAAVGGVFELHAEVADAVGGFDEGAADIVVADDAELEGDAALGGVAHGGGDAAVGDGDDDVGVDMAFAGEFGADAFSGGVDADAFDDGVGAGEVDVFEDAEAGGGAGEGAQRLDALVVDDDDLAGFDVADEFGADDVERAGFAGQDPGIAALGVLQLAKDEGADAHWVAGADQGLVGEGDQGIGADDLFEGVDQAVDDGGIFAHGDEVDEDLAVHGGLEQAAAFYQGAA